MTSAQCVSAQHTKALSRMSHKAAPWGVGTVIVTILQMRKPRNLEVGDIIPG